MLESADHTEAEVVIVGAGIAGLSAAHQLTSAGVTTVVLEAAPYVGGRMSTEELDGFRLDRIGQLLSTSYPELRRTPGLGALVLHPLSPGILVHSEGRDRRTWEPGGGWGSARGPARSARGALTAARALA
ncbi:FAD-dependent oxidoreductase, partial [Streptomyces sp. T-3]|nr:FAD-dependent oxidoreductase [Streptomyces sp. T-3]